MNESKIRWTGVTWNPVHGCSKVSDGCKFCYAERISLDKGFTQKPWSIQNERENVQLKPHKIAELRRVKPGTMVFVNSMSDLFHRMIPDDYLAQIFAAMNDRPDLIFQILTKRPERAVTWAGEWGDHIWMGTSVEDSRVIHRIETLRACPAKVRFISAEPLLGPLGKVDLTGYDWLIVGGESGTGYRRMDQAWARELRTQCLRYGVAFYYKQDSGYRTELRPWLFEADGSAWVWEQYPGDLRRPYQVDPVSGAALDPAAAVVSPEDQQLSLF